MSPWALGSMTVITVLVAALVNIMFKVQVLQSYCLSCLQYLYVYDKQKYPKTVHS